jgi:branched-chain amino acid transport system substrate-binding protein
MPLTGNLASAGQQAKAAVEIGAEIVNGVHPEFASLRLAASVGLPNLKGAKLKIITVWVSGKQYLSVSRPRRRGQLLKKWG